MDVEALELVADELVLVRALLAAVIDALGPPPDTPEEVIAA